LIRLRCTAPPTFRLTVSPVRAPVSLPLRRTLARRMKPSRTALRPACACRNSGRRRSLPITAGGSAAVALMPIGPDTRRAWASRQRVRSGRKPLAPARPAAGKNLATVLRGHAGAEAMTASAHEAAWLKGPFHGTSPSGSVRRASLLAASGRRRPHTIGLQSGSGPCRNLRLSGPPARRSARGFPCPHGPSHAFGQ
jgi:hypothetical protein